MDRELWSKLESEEALTLVESLELEDALARQDACGLNLLPATLVDQEPSLEWRSDLNARLRQAVPAKPRPNRTLWLAGFATAASAAVLGMMAYQARPTADPVDMSSSIAARDAAPIPDVDDMDAAHLIVTSYESGVRNASVGIAPPQETPVVASGFDWEGFDDSP